MTKKKYRVLKDGRFEGKRSGDEVQLDLSAQTEQRYVDAGLLEKTDDQQTTTTKPKEG